ncbi:unnamed protein product [Rotaria sordida]|uniref:N-acetyltransferase domain-containing protein n=1 Tax=Rotaria sordida TaxID=392033 RepID=A0A819VVD3_9BILA|nr:unnamed protein product [Rotaria sordida]CAF0928629.1 unnamed protein product [Rotaria sordida]CAF3522920.1 unnamed protein product [Rotaria sordida]CAF4115042.1 unnamed protein product [Rotaria sordida]
MTDSHEYVYEVIDNETDARTCAQLIAEEFAAHEPTCVFAQITPQYFFNEVSWPMITEVLDERLSILARHRPSGEIIAAIFASDLFLVRETHPYNASGPPAPIAFIDLLNEMDDIFVRQDFSQELKPNMVLHVMTGATRAHHSGKGVGSRLRAAMCNHARDTKGFQYALVQASNPATRHIYTKKMGGKELTIFDPRTWVWKKKDDGLSRPFEDYKGGSVPNILIKLASVEDE